MLYHLLFPLHVSLPILNVFRYITFRASMAALTAFLVSLILSPIIIRIIRRMQIGEHVRKEDSQKLYELHSKKQGLLLWEAS